MVSGAVMFLLTGVALWVIIHLEGGCFGFLVELDRDLSSRGNEVTVAICL